MKRLLTSIAVSGLFLINAACPGNNNTPGGAPQIVGTPTTQCLSSIPTGVNGQVGTMPYGGGYGGYGYGSYGYGTAGYGYGAGYPYGGGSCMGYPTGGYVNPYNYGMYGYGFNNGFNCGSGVVPLYSNYYGLGCINASYLSPYNVMYYGYNNNAFSMGGYFNFGMSNWGGSWSPYNVAISCVTSYPGCNCVTFGGQAGGVGVCTR